MIMVATAGFTGMIAVLVNSTCKTSAGRDFLLFLLFFSLQLDWEITYFR